MSVSRLAVRRAAAPEPHSAHVREKRERKRAEILQAALLTFRAKGYRNATLDDIAERLGMRKTALYHYFPDKQAILHECHRESLAELTRIMREAKAQPTAAAQLAHVIREHVRMMTDTLALSPLAFEITALPSAGEELAIAGRDRYERQLRQIIERGMRDGEFRPGDAKLATFVVLGAVNWIARWYKPEGSLQAADLGDEFVARLLDGLRAASALPARRAATRAGRVVRPSESAR